MKFPDLLINTLLPDIQRILSTEDQLVLQATPGAGKTTIVPLALLDQPWLKEQKILMLEPRRMAARTAAERMASILGEQAGATVGYRIRQQHCVGQQTRIEVITEGILTRLLQNDPQLSGVGLVIFDEFHERNLQTDLGLALSLQARDFFRENQPLKILVMSATLEGDTVAALLGDAPQLHCAGKMYPVDVIYDKTCQLSCSIIKPMTDLVRRALHETEGSLLVFLPGQAEIHQLQKELGKEKISNIQILPLYGALPLAEQVKAIAPLAGNNAGKRKIVLATDIAETSLTIEGITTVVDSGLSRQPRFDPQSGMIRLQTRRISIASSTQRMGRAGRTQAGYCYRLWSRETQKTLEKQTPAEILQADLSPLALQLLQWGVTKPAELTWMDEPPAAAFSQALDLLYSLGAIKQDPRQEEQLGLSTHGMQMARFPVHPRLSHMLIKSVQINQTRVASALATLLSEKDPLKHYGANISAKVEVLLGEIPCEQQFRGWYRRSQQQCRVFEKLCADLQVDKINKLPRGDVPGYLISQAYPDRVALQRNSSRQLNPVYQLSNGRAAVLDADETLASSGCLAVAELGGPVNRREDRIYAAAPLNRDLFRTLLADQLKMERKVAWNEQKKLITAESQQKFGSLVIDRKSIVDVTDTERQAIMRQLLTKKGLTLLPWNKTARQWVARLQCVNTLQDENETWPDVSEQGLLNSLEDWLFPFMPQFGRLEDFQKLDLTACLQSLLSWSQTKKLDELAPVTLQVPSGSNIKIDYSCTPPVLSVKLQEMFGCVETPAIARGKIPLLVHLLSPAGKPLQITSDLAGFWSGSYQQVKKDMKGRYPKHPWPDDPLKAEATRFTKNRMNAKK